MTQCSGIGMLGWFAIAFPAVFISLGLNRLATHSSQYLILLLSVRTTNKYMNLMKQYCAVVLLYYINYVLYRVNSLDQTDVDVTSV